MFQDEHRFWERMRKIILGNAVNTGIDNAELASGLRTLRTVSLIVLLLINALWLALLSTLYFHINVQLAKHNIYGLIAGVVYGLVLGVQLLGMTVHRIQSTFMWFGRTIFGKDLPVWVHQRTGN